MNRLLLAPILLFALHAFAEEVAPPAVPQRPMRFDLSEFLNPDQLLNNNDLSIFSPAICADEICELIKLCFPGIWDSPDGACIAVSDEFLVVYRCNDLQPEFERFFAWLRECTTTEARATVIVAKLKPAQLAAVERGPGVYTLAEFDALADGADEADLLISDLKGREGLKLTSSAQQDVRYVQNVEHEGLLYKPVIKQARAGLKTEARVMRLPDGRSVRVDLHALWNGTPRFSSTPFSLKGIESQRTATGSRDEFVPIKPKAQAAERTARRKEALKDAPADPLEAAEPAADETPKEEETAVEDTRAEDDAEPRTQELTEQVPMNPRATAFTSNLALSHASQLQYELKTTVIVPRGNVVLAGIVDVGAATGAAEPDRRAVFVRAEAGAEGIPSFPIRLEKDKKETLRLIPKLSCTVPLDDHKSPLTVPLASDACLIGSPFAAAEVPGIVCHVENLLEYFTEYMPYDNEKHAVRNGWLLVTNLPQREFNELQATFKDAVKRGFATQRVRVAVLAMPKSKARRLLMNAEPLDAEAFAALCAAEGVSTLAQTTVLAQPNRRTFQHAAFLSERVEKLETCGDTLVPVIHPDARKGYSVNLLAHPQTGSANFNVSTDLRIYFGAPESPAEDLQTPVALSGAKATVLATLHTTLAPAPQRVLTMQGKVTAPPGRYVIGCSQPMPDHADGKPDPRQAVLFLRADAGVRP